VREIIGALVAGLLAAALAAGCSGGAGGAGGVGRSGAAGGAGGSGGSGGSGGGYVAAEDSCYAFGVQAIKRHVTVTTVPRACAGLSRAQVNAAVGRAIKDVVGPHPKAVARHLAHRDQAYLAQLISTVPAPAAAPTVAAPAPAPARSSGNLPLALAALGAWLVTAAAGSYLLAGWLAVTGRRRARRLRTLQVRATGLTRGFVVGHFGLALTGLGIWIAFLGTGVAALAWVSVGLVILIAGLGMGVLAADLPEPGARRRGGLPVTVIAIHGALATTTILLVLLAALGAG
jgi:manganese efflux pump family protein